MKLAVVENINDNFFIKSEHNDEQSALVNFHNECKVLWNEPDVERATVKILDEQLNCYEGHSEFIYHGVEPEGE